MTDREHITIGAGSSMGGSEPVIADAVRFGNLLFLSGRAAVDPATLGIVGDGFEEQAQIVLRDIGAVLEQAGAGWEHVIRIEAFLADGADFPRLEQDLVRAVRAAPAVEDDGRHAVRRPGHPDRAPGHSRASGLRPVSGRVVIVGGGVAGLCCAYYLRRAGHRGDGRREQPGRLAGPRSRTAAGCAPPRPGRCPSRGSRCTGCGRSSTATRPSTSSRATCTGSRRGCCGFGRTATRSDHAHGTAAIARLGHDVFDLVEEMRADGVEFELHKQGMVFAARSPDDARAELRKLEPDARATATTCPTTSSPTTSCTSSSRRWPRSSAPAS